VTEKEEEKEFRVADRRRILSDTGEIRKEDPAAEKPAESSAGPAGPESQGAIPEMTFSAFVIGLGTQAMLSLGQFPDPESGRSSVDLSAARQLIDVLGILMEKTRGNLDKREEELLNHLLFDLRTKFVEQSKQK
jgi:hypothetical protein